MKYYANITEPTIKEDIKLLLMIKTKFKEHKVSNEKNIYRLHHIYYSKDLNGVNHESHAVFEPFMLPEGMTRDDGMKVLSYLTDFIEKKANIQQGTLKSVIFLENALNLERFGFKRTEVKNNDEIVDLFTIQGRTKRFKLSEHYFKYFNWYKENVNKEEVINIYKNIGLEFDDLIFKSEKQLVKSR